MRFRIREIKEVKEEESIKKKREDGFKKIKPEGAITFEEACAFWEQEFTRLAEES